MSKYADIFRSSCKATRDAGNQANSEESAEVAAGRFTLLFVDDEVSVLNALKRIFTEENYEIHIATSAKDALAVMENEKVHLVISDHRMPGMTGAELLKQIKLCWPHTIRIMLTGHADVSSVMGAVNEGAVYKFITKPWNDDDLRLTVSLALQQYTLLQENRKLKDIARDQHLKIKNYSNLFDEYRGILGSILIKSGRISSDQLTRAIREANKDEFIGDTVVRLGFATESHIVEALQKHQNLAYVDLDEMQINPMIVRFLPRELCEKNRLLPLRLEGRQLHVAMADPSDILKIDNIAMMTGFKVIPAVAKSSAILSKIKTIYGDESSQTAADYAAESDVWDPFEEIDVVIEDDETEVSTHELLNSSGVPPIIRIVNAIIMEALRYKASDIHIEPKTKYTIVRYRIDGMLHTKIKIPSHLHAATVSRVKILSKMDISERRKPQDGRITMKTGTRLVDVRVSSMPTISGEKIVMRILDKGAALKQVSELGMLDDDLKKLQLLIKKPQGIVISTGPTGSGKTTTLYSILHEMLSSTKNYETIEDPVEYFLEEASQIYVRERVGLSFASVLRSTLRQDPDVILVGEIRDSETADVAFKAALTGHMVLTSLHTNNTVASLTRLMDIGIKPYLIASAIEGIIAQRLVRRICPHCKTSVRPDAALIDMLTIPRITFDEAAAGKGCTHCNNTGYLGRIGIFEIFIMNEEFRELVSSSYRESEIRSLARTGGMRTLLEDGLEKVRLGITTLDELVRVIGPPARHERPCEGCGMLIDQKFLFCPYCGVFRQNLCHNCKSPLETDWITCPSCGTRKGTTNKA
ncbi:MAG TPA: ATPase, T2SS/T4P/T4SS family [Dissulfurispiraceae bacterium]|nr:ATPase, T2SS/T4P/T4SS family [Dissulfurispiraceae bacterium]